MESQQSIREPEEIETSCICGLKCRANCHYFSSVNNVVSFIIFILAYFIIFKNIFTQSALGFKGTEGFIYNIIVFAAIVVHFLRIYLSISNMDVDLVYCREYLSKMTRSQRKIDFFLRVLIQFVIVFFIGYNQIFIGNFVSWMLIIYIILFSWDFIVGSISIYNYITRKVVVKSGYIVDFVFFAIADFLGTISFIYMQYVKDQRALFDNQNIMYAVAVSSGIFALLMVTVIGHFFYKSIRKDGLLRFIRGNFNMTCYLETDI
jgi:hypothetical protein